jgi:hypothetical protein
VVRSDESQEIQYWNLKDPRIITIILLLDGPDRPIYLGVSDLYLELLLFEVVLFLYTDKWRFGFDLFFPVGIATV